MAKLNQCFSSNSSMSLPQPDMHRCIIKMLKGHQQFYIKLSTVILVEMNQNIDLRFK